MATPNFANRTIWTGDNLDILRGLNSECVDLIYLDPPFNSNKNYSAPVGSKAAGAAFKDTWTLSDLDVAWMGIIADKHPAMYQVLQAAGLTHGKGMQSYLCMMGIRLVEMRRVLKDTGSIYLHCDPTAGHYLKLLMDAIFGVANFRNEITWRRTVSHNDVSRNYGSITDTLLFYSKSEAFVFHVQYMPYSDEHIRKIYTYVDEDGRRYCTSNIRSPGPRPNLTYEYKGYQPHPNGWTISRERMERLDREGRLHFPKSKNGRIRLKLFLDEMPGVPVVNVWDDIQFVQSHAKERIGYPTQKPLALLDRVIRASSNDGDVVLDPFCGCATSLIAAEKLERQWVGIDLSPKAVELVHDRLKSEMSVGPIYHSMVTARTDIPKRTDLEKPVNYRQHRHILFGEQEGRCNGCRTDFPFKNMTVDHVIPRSRGGTDHLENLQLLCNYCNSLKGNRSQEYLIAELGRRSDVAR